MSRLVLVLAAIEKAMRAERHGYHYLWAAGKLLRCTYMAARVGWLDWS